MRNSDAVLSPILAAVLAVDHRPVAVGVDGQGGSGKSTFARELLQILPITACIVHGDDFYSEMSTTERESLDPEEGYQRYFDWRRLKSEVLRSIGDDSAAPRYRQYNWDTCGLGGWLVISMPEVVIVEGVYTLRPELRDAFDITVFLQAGKGTRLRRQISRGENSSFWIEHWIAAEDYYIANTGPWEWVDFTVQGE
jgi:phosphoribulokinase